jgi:hypothetical protein
MLSDLEGLPSNRKRSGLLIRMKVLLYGMQSSGASALAFMLAQKPDSVAFVDIWNMFAAPELGTERDAVAKVVVTTAFSLDVHKRRFRPDVTVLGLRHPTDTYESLIGKTYANESGLIDEKFSVLEEVFRAGTGFDHIVHYEDFVFSPRGLVALCERIGWQIGCDALLFGRTQREIEKTNAAAWPDVVRQLKYGIGNLQTQRVVRDRVRFSEPSGRTAHLPNLCPTVFEHYSELRADRKALWHVPSPGLLSCSLGTLLRGLTEPSDVPQQLKKVGYELRWSDGTPQCRVDHDTSVVLHPAAPGRETRLTVSGLPGRPFNRICGLAYAEDPRALGTNTHIRIEGTNGECLAQQQFTLCHADMRSIDFGFEPQSSTIALSLGVSLAENVDMLDHAGVRFLELRLEQNG